MVGPDPRSPEEIRREIESERERLTEAVGALRKEMDLTRALGPRLPAIAAAALGAGFVLGGGLRATLRLLTRRRHRRRARP